MLRVRCLGQLSAVRDGQPLAGAALQPRRLAILAILARAGDRGVTREKMIGYLWPDSEEERARRLLSQAVYMLRRDMGDEEAITGVRELRLGANVATDVAEFQEAFAARAYERAAEVYAGPFLDGFHIPGAPELERWIDEERRGLAHDAETALEKCAVACEARGDHASAVTWWRRLAANDPINARVAVRLMRALAAAGDRNGAIRHAAIHEALVKEQLELPADVDVVRLANELRSDALTSASAPVTVAPPAPPPLTPPPPSRASESAPTPELVTVSTPAPQRQDLLAPVGTVDAPASGPSVRRSRVVAFATAVAVVVVIAIAAVLWSGRTRQEVDTGTVVSSRVIVAPLENATGDSTLDAIGPMVAEWVTQGLLRTGLVQVVDARTMLEASRDAGAMRGADYLRTVAERTSAGTVVSGSYFIEGDQLRFLTRVTSAPSGELRHTVDVVNAPVARPTAALEPLRQRVTGALAVLLDGRLNNWTARASQPPTYEAYSEFLLGMEAFGRDYDRSVRHFTRASQLDSNYWQAKLWAGMSYANLRRYPPADSLFGILDQNRSLLLAYDQANLDYFYGGFVRGDWETSYRGSRRMLELAPAAAHALYAAGLTAQITNRPREAIESLRRVDIEQGWGRAWAPRVLNLIARSHHQLGNHQDELSWAVRLRDSEPNVGWTHLAEVRALAALGRGDDALARAVDGAAFPATTETWEDYTPGDFLWQSGKELRAHGAGPLARQALERAERWYASRPAAEKRTAGYRLGLARVLDYLERPAEAHNLYAGLAAEDPSSIEYLGGVGVTAARLRRTDEADSIAARLVGDGRPFAFGAARLWAARIAAVRGDRQTAVSLLHRSRREGHSRLYLFHTDRDFDSLRDFPAFRELLQPR